MADLLTTLAPDDEPAEHPWWTEHVTWGAVIGIGFLIYELTARPAFGIAVACSKFGWSDFQTALWLLRRDPHRGRGVACFWFYLAAGLWRVTVAAFLLTGSLLFLVALFGNQPMADLVPLGMTAATGIVLLAVVPWLGALKARRHGLKIWVDSTVNAYRQHDIWPPVPTGFNSVAGLLFPTLMVPTTVTAIIAFQLGYGALIPIAIFAEGISMWAMLHGVTAQHPDDCWGDDAEEDDDGTAGEAVEEDAGVTASP